MSIIEGICRNCGAHYFGWVLKSESNPRCDKCGSNLEVIENGTVIRAGLLSLQIKEVKEGIEKV
jgi:transcription initiation factor IIE alpha subunit